MSEKHTPGPWHTAFGSDGSIMAYGPDDFRIHDAGNSTREYMPVAEANARLIAAAPDLLEACRPVLNEAKQREDYMHDTWNPDAHVELTLTIAEIRAIHDAVAKAKGAHG